MMTLAQIDQHISDIARIVQTITDGPEEVQLAVLITQDETSEIRKHNMIVDDTMALDIYGAVVNRLMLYRARAVARELHQKV